MGWKVNSFAGLALAAVAAAVVVPTVPGHYLASDDEVKGAVRTMDAATADLRAAVATELAASPRARPGMSDRHHPKIGALQVHVDEDGAIFVRNPQYDLVLRYAPQRVAKGIEWHCSVAPGKYAIEGCTPAPG